MQHFVWFAGIVVVQEALKQHNASIRGNKIKKKDPKDITLPLDLFCLITNPSICYLL